MKLPAGVSVSIFSLWLMSVTPLAVSVSIMFSKPFVERPKRLILSELVFIAKKWYNRRYEKRISSNKLRK